MSTIADPRATSGVSDPAPAEEPRDWYFTFGHGQRGISTSNAPPHASEPQPLGFPLDGRYVVIHGTYETARIRMIETFGLVWSWQYPSADAAGVEEFGLTELVITANPARTPNQEIAADELARPSCPGCGIPHTEFEGHWCNDGQWRRWGE